MDKVFYCSRSSLSANTRVFYICAILLSEYKSYQCTYGVLFHEKTREPQHRPTFQELLDRLKDLLKQYMIQFQAARSATGDVQKELHDAA